MPENNVKTPPENNVKVPSENNVKTPPENKVKVPSEKSIEKDLKKSFGKKEKSVREQLFLKLISVLVFILFFYLIFTSEELWHALNKTKPNVERSFMQSSCTVLQTTNCDLVIIGNNATLDVSRAKINIVDIDFHICKNKTRNQDIFMLSSCKFNSLYNNYEFELQYQASRSDLIHSGNVEISNNFEITQLKSILSKIKKNIPFIGKD
jgi:hypothetical protein